MNSPHDDRAVGPLLFGIVNLTEDSFSDGGRFLRPDAALEHARELFGSGADVLDLGAASSHPDSLPVSAEEEIRRLEPVIDELGRESVPLSVDSCQPEVQAFALKRDVAYLNDIKGFADDGIYPELARARSKLVVMFSILGGQRAVREVTDPVRVFASLLEFFEERIDALRTAGVARDRLILDPGMGFFLGSNPETSLYVLSRLGELRQRHGLPVFVSVSRKSFLGAVTGREVAERGPATLAAELFAARRGADCIRTHEPGALRDALLVQERLDRS